MMKLEISDATPLPQLQRKVATMFDMVFLAAIAFWPVSPKVPGKPVDYWASKEIIVKCTDANDVTDRCRKMGMVAKALDLHVDRNGVVSPASIVVAEWPRSASISTKSANIAALVKQKTVRFVEPNHVFLPE